MFEIISAADGDFLVEVLNGVAMLVGGGNFRGMMMLGMVIGLLIVGARALLTQRLELQWVLIGWLMYAVMFVPTVTVTVEDLGTGNTNPVDNVPIGVAAIGAVTSQLGLGMAEAFQTVFAPPGTPGSGPITGYADSLNILAAMREPGYGDANDAAAGAAVNVDMQRTVSRYLRDCVLYAIAVEDSPLSLTWERLRTSPNLLADIEVEAVSWWTVTYLDPADPDGTPQTCQAAYAAIAGQLDGGGFETEWFEYLGAKLGVDNAQAEVQDAMDHLFGIGGNAQQFMRNALLAKELQLADLDYQAAVGNSAGVIMRTQAIEQRRVQWAAEKTLFEEMARPLMGYIEGFFYAVSPIMAFVFVLGQFGVMLFGRYLLLAAWIQLWMPIMAINNLYIHRAAERSLEELSDGGLVLMSMTGMDSVWTEAASWIAVGGMMAAATPLLALMLLTGSYFAMTQLTNRMAGRDFTKESIMAPDLVQPAPVASVGAQFSQEAHWLTGHVYGTRRPGAEGVAPQIEWDYEQRMARTETNQMMASLGERYQAMRGAAVQETLSTQQGWEQGLSTLESRQGQYTAMDQAVLKQASNIANRHIDMSALTQSQQRSVNHTLGMSIAAGGAIPFVNFDAGMKAAIENAVREEGKSADEVIQTMSQEAATTDSSAAAYQHALSGSDSAMQKSAFAEAVGMTRSTDFKDIAEGLEQTSHSLGEMNSYIAEMGVEQNMSAIAFGERFKPHKDALYATAIEAGVSQGEINNLTGEMVNYYGVEDHDQAQTAAIGVLLTQHDPGAAFGAIAVSQGAMRGDLEFGRAISEHTMGAERPASAPPTGAGVTEAAIRQGHGEGTAEIGLEAALGMEGAEAFYEHAQETVDDTAEANVVEQQQRATEDRTRQLVNDYAPVELKRGLHPEYVSRISSPAHGGRYAPPAEGSAQGDALMQQFTARAAEHGLPQDLQAYFARQEAQTKHGMVFARENHPSREELVANYPHGEAVVGYIDNAVNTTDGPDSLGRGGPPHHLGAAAHIVANPLEGGGSTGNHGGSDAGLPPAGTGAAGAEATAARAVDDAPPGDAPPVQPGGDTPAAGLTDPERATVADGMVMDTPGVAGGVPSAQFGGGTPGNGPSEPAPVRDVSTEPIRTGAAATAETAANLVGDAPPRDAPSARSGGDAPAAGAAAVATGGIASGQPEAPRAEGPNWGDIEAARSGDGAGAPSTQGVPTQNGGDATAGALDVTPVVSAQAPATEVPPPSPEALAEQLYEANITRGVPENTAWVVAQRAAGADTAGPEYDRHMEGMQQELAAEPKAVAAVQNAIDDYVQGSTSGYEYHMDDVANFARDARGRPV